MARIAGTTAEQTRERIIGAALELFAAQTYAGTSLRDIAEHLHLTKAAVYYHFPSKEHLLDAIVGPLAEQLEQIADTMTAARLQLPAGDGEAENRFKVAAIRELVEVQASNIRVFRALFADSSAHRALRHRRPPENTAEQIEKAFTGDVDELELIRHRCALGVLYGSVARTVKALDRPNSCEPRCGQELAIPQAHREIIVRAALDILGLGAYASSPGTTAAGSRTPTPASSSGPASGTCRK